MAAPYIDCPVSDPARAPAENASAEERTEQSRNGVLETTRHHPNAGEDQTAEADDSASIDGERFERSHERLSAGEVHRSLRVSCARECERNEGGSHHAECVGNSRLGEG
jgi:hypothetical protein